MLSKNSLAPKCAPFMTTTICMPEHGESACITSRQYGLRIARYGPPRSARMAQDAATLSPLNNSDIGRRRGCFSGFEQDAANTVKTLHD